MNQKLKESDANCINCAFFEKFEEQKRNDNVIGACKANPPQIPYKKEGNGLGIWPTVLGSFWCAIFTVKGEN